MRSGNTTPVFIVASDVRGNGLHPWNIVAGNLDELSIPGGVAIDRSYFNRLGSKGLGDTAEIRDQKAEVTAVTSGIRSFTTTPYVFTTLDRGRDYVGMMPNKATYLLVHLAPGANVEVVRRRLQRGAHRSRGADARRDSPPAAARSGCSEPGPAPRCSPARCSA